MANPSEDIFDEERASVDDPIIVSLLREINQTPETRQSLLAQLEGEFDNRCVLAFFTSFNQPVIIDDGDADIIECVLQKSNLKNGLTVIINSPGGDGLAAERILNVCRSYSKGDFEVVVPKMAKSAATMITFGANKIWMSETSELGPIDPQIFRNNRLVPAHSVIASYEELLKQAVRTKGNIEPYLQQLGRYDASEVKSLRVSQKLSESIAVKALQSGMMNGKTEPQIRRDINPFINPEVMNSHGRRIGIETADQCGLTVGKIELDGKLWQILWELYVRVDWVVSVRCSKLVETKDHHFQAPVVREDTSNA